MHDTMRTTSIKQINEQQHGPILCHNTFCCTVSQDACNAILDKHTARVIFHDEYSFGNSLLKL